MNLRVCADSGTHRGVYMAWEATCKYDGQNLRECEVIILAFPLVSPL